MSRFAILCRVSSEIQKEGESLSVQIKTLQNCVQSLGGTIVKEYIGQESATKSDRPILDSLLADCSQGLFNCVMVYDSSRLDRDPVRAKIIFATFKKYGIKLYFQMSQYDLNEPEFAFIASIMAEVSQFQVAIQAKKSLSSRIERARRGFPMSSLPHGRRLVNSPNSGQQAIYEIIPEFQEKAQKIWSMYVEEGMALKKIAKHFNTSEPQIHFILFKYSGHEWIQKVTNPDGQDETIITKVPPLLTQEQINKAHLVTRKNQQFNAVKYDYLLGGKIRCGTCGATFVGQSNKSGDTFKNRHYRHSNRFRTDICIKTIQVSLIERAGLNSISELFSSIDNLKQAIENALVKSKDKVTPEK